MTQLKQLTRKTLEATFRTQAKQLHAEKMKVGVVQDRIKNLIKYNMNRLKECKQNANRETDFDLLRSMENSKTEINGRLRALLSWLDGKSQFQFQKEIEDMRVKIKVSYDNIYWAISGIMLGFFATNVLHVLLKLWAEGRI